MTSPHYAFLSHDLPSGHDAARAESGGTSLAVSSSRRRGSAYRSGNEAAGYAQLGQKGCVLDDNELLDVIPDAVDVVRFGIL
jgi:hypothetical protein